MKTGVATSTAVQEIVRRKDPASSAWDARKRQARISLGRLLALTAVSAVLCAQEPDGWIRTYDGGTGDGLERPAGILTDAEGAVYVSASTGWGTVTVKYGAGGELLWETAKPGAGAVGMAFDSSGRLLVAKSHADSGAIVRYDGDGTETVVVQVRGEIRGMVRDSSGALYVSSADWWLGSFRTTKYDTGFRQRWSEIFAEGPVTNRLFIALASNLAVDSEGNPYAAGTHLLCLQACGLGYAAVKYGSDDGTILWSTLEAPVHDSFLVTGMVIDPSDHCIVLGSVDDCGSTAAGLALVKYGPAGVELWTTCYEPVLQESVSAVAVASDSSGNVYVSGAGCGTEDCSYVTLKYDSGGNLLWEAELLGGRPSALTVDPSGAVIVTGTELSCEGQGCDSAYLTVKYGADGRELWVRRSGAPPGEEASASAVALDAAGGVQVAGTIARDYGVIKYDEAGGEAWSVTHNTPMERDAAPIGVRPAGDAEIYVVSNSCDAEGCDVVALKYDRTGRVVWERQLDDARATAMTGDDSGNLYVVGGGVGPRVGSWMAKYELDGTRRWLTHSDDPNPAEIAVDFEGNVHVAGGRGGRVLAKYDADGIEIWSARSATHRLLQMKVDPAGYVYLAETSVPMATVALFDQGGNLIWRVPFATGGQSQIHAIDVDADGNLYATGFVWICTGRCAGVQLTVKYDQGGRELWSARSPELHQSPRVAALRVDPSGDVYVSYGVNLSTVPQLMTAKYRGDGSEAWIRRRGEFVNDRGASPRIELDATGALYVHGVTRETVKYSGDGYELWSMSLSNVAGTSFTLGPERLYLAGRSGGGDSVILQHTHDAFFSEVNGSMPPVDVAVVAPQLELPPEEGEITHRWSFGDGRVVGTSAEHTYDRAGAFEVELTSTGRSLGVTTVKNVYVGCPGGDVTPWTSAEIGVTAFPGAARLEVVDGRQELQICSGGTEIGGSKDSFHFVYQEVSGDVLLSARVSTLGEANVRTGVMLRESLEPASRHVSLVLDQATTSRRYHLLRREETGGSTRDLIRPRIEDTSLWVRIRRQGDAFIASSSLDGSEWVDEEPVVLDFPETFLAGFAASRRFNPPRAMVDPTTVRCDHLTLQASPVQRPFRRGDANADGDVNLPDATVVLDVLFGGGASALGCEKAGDVDDSGALGITDAVYLLAHLFQSGPAPAEPARTCGTDPTLDTLSCTVYEACP